MRTWQLALSLTLVAGACASPQRQISLGLQDYGLDTARADCVGGRLQRDLSIGQLQELARAATAYRTNDANPGRLTISDFVRVAGAIRDAEVPLAVGRAAIGCRVLP